LVLIASIAANEALLMGLGGFMFYCSAMKLHALAAEEGMYGDFSAGYTSLEEDEPPRPRPKKVNPVKRWLQARAARRLQREVEQRTLKGFRDYVPSLMIPRERVLQTAREVYRSYGFAPIDTPALEYAEVLLGKGGAESDRLVYKFKDHGDRDVALRFDLTVPFARFSAQHLPQLGTPFKRYAMGPVWRGENTSAGRYREFWQCDFDTIGTTSNAADIEVALVINDLFAALEIDRFEIRVNNRMVLNGLLESLGLAG